MAARKRICVCGVQVPFVRGGAEVLTETLCDQLRARGFEVELVQLPFSWSPRVQLLKSCLAWRLLDLRMAGERPVDLVIATRFPSYLISHPNKVVWLVHQYRQAYDLLGTRYSDLAARHEDRRLVARIRAMDRRTLAEARAVYAISGNTAARLQRFNGLEAGVLYPPPKLGDAYRCGPCGDYVLAVGRLDALKRFDQLLRALAHCRQDVRCRIAGDGPEMPALRELVGQLGLEGRVELLGRVGDDHLLDLYAGCRAVYYGPYDEDYGYVTVEAFRSGKPVLTLADSGGVLELVADGVNGFVCPPGAPRKLARRLDQLAADADLAQRLGAAGRERVAGIAWEPVIRALTASLTLPAEEVGP